MRRVVILGRGGAGKSVLARRLGEVTGLPVTELDALFWQLRPASGDGQPRPVPMEAARWAACHQGLVQRDAWILDGDLGPYDDALAVRLAAADTVIVLDFSFPRCAWRTIRRGQEAADYWRWVRNYRRRSLPETPHAKVYVLRTPRMVRRFVADVIRGAEG